MRIHLVTRNPFKVEELRPIAHSAGIELLHVAMSIDELQTMDGNALIRDKTFRAFDSVRLPLIVDHGSLAIDCLGGMPGHLTQLFWDRLEDRLCDIVHFLGGAEATASTLLGFCDGRRIFTFAEAQRGQIAERPRGDRKFQWDTIFIPEGHTATYGEMSVRDKNVFSQRRRAFDRLLTSIKR
jgi:XTP/dITP diphosphohydrolase